MNFINSFKNLFSLNIINLLIALSLVIILVLLFLKNKNIDLFTTDIEYLQTIIDKYKSKQMQKTEFATILATQSQKIKDLEKQVSTIFSST